MCPQAKDIGPSGRGQQQAMMGDIGPKITKTLIENGKTIVLSYIGQNTLKKLVKSLFTLFTISAENAQAIDNQLLKSKTIVNNVNNCKQSLFTNNLLNANGLDPCKQCKQ